MHSTISGILIVITLYYNIPALFFKYIKKSHEQISEKLQ